MPAWVFLSVGVMMKLAGAKLTSALWVMPLVSRPAIGWLAINSAPSGRAACTGSTTPRFTPETSVTIVPGLDQMPVLFDPLQQHGGVEAEDDAISRQ